MSKGWTRDFTATVRILGGDTYIDSELHRKCGYYIVVVTDFNLVCVFLFSLVPVCISDYEKIVICSFRLFDQ